MTQTIHNQTVNSEEHIAYDVYMHPNNSSASHEDRESQYRYSVYAEKYSMADFAEEAKWADVDEGRIEQLKEILDLFAEASKNDEEEIWVCRSENGHDDYIEYHATRDDADSSLRSQCV